jgi:hypothetical protein
VIGLVLIGFGLNLPAVLVDHSRYLVEFGERDPAHYLDRSILRLEDSPLTQQWPTVFEMANLYARPGTWTAAQTTIVSHWRAYQGPANLETLSTHLMWIDEFFRLNVPDLWWVHLMLLGFSPLLIGLAVAGLMGLAVVSGRKVLIRLKDEG